jgi:quinol monooxygenase YgiN
VAAGWTDVFFIVWQGKLRALQQEVVAKQAKQNLLDRLAQLKTLEALQRAAAARKPQVEAGYEQERRELTTTVTERQDALRLLERLADEVQQEQEKVLENERSRDAHESEVAHLTEVWKEIQKRNAHRKAAVQVATGVMVTDEDDCNRVLDQQTQSIQEMHQRQKQLEVGDSSRGDGGDAVHAHSCFDQRLQDEKIDISTHVKRTKRTIESLSKQVSTVEGALQWKGVPSVVTDSCFY